MNKKICASLLAFLMAFGSVAPAYAGEVNNTPFVNEQGTEQVSSDGTEQPGTAGTELPEAGGTEETELPEAGGTEETELPEAGGTEETELPETDGTENTKLPETDGTENTELPETDGTEDTELLETDGTEETELPETDGTEETELPETGGVKNPKDKNKVSAEDAEALNDPLYGKYQPIPEVANDMKLAPSLIHNPKFNTYDKTYGIDVSKYQGKIDWTKVKNSGVSFAMIRLGYRGLQDGQLQLDTEFANNMAGAHAAGVQIGIYFYSQALNTVEAEQEAQFVLNYLAQYPKYVTYPVIIDMESYAGSRLDNAALSADVKTAICNAFCLKIKNAGYTAGIYSNKTYLETQLRADVLGLYYYVWMAHYGNQTSYAGTYNMWQYSETGTVSGINTYVGMNVAYSLPASAAPKNFKQTAATASSVSLSWDAVKNADGYRLSRYNISGKLEKAYNLTDTRFTNKKLTEGTTYQFKVCAFYKNVNGTYTFGKETDFVNAYTAPGQVQGVAAKTQSSDSITITWRALSGATDYQILRYNEKTKKYDEIAATSNTSYKVEKLAAGTLYKFKIRGYITLSGNQKGVGKTSAMVSAYTKPNKVTGIKKTRVTENSVTITWNAQSGASVYMVSCYDVKGKLQNSQETTGNTYTQTGLISGRTYQFKVRSCMETKNSKIWSDDSAAFKVKVVPKQVTGLKQSSTNSKSIELKWKSSPGADGYRVYLYNNSTKKYKTLGTTTKCSYTMKNLKMGTKYKIKVAAFVKNGKATDRGKYSRLLTVATTPGKVKGLKRSAATADSFTVKWSRVKNADGYRVYYYDADGSLVKSFGAKSTQYTVKNVEAGKYTCRVKAYIKTSGKNVWGALSNSVKITIKPARVSGLYESSAREDSVTLRWKEVNGADGYRVYLLNAATGKYETAGNTSRCSYTIDGLASGKKYSVKVAAYVKNGSSTELGQNSSELEIATKPDKVKNIKQTAAASDSITVTWDNVKNADGYRLYCYDMNENLLYSFYATGNKFTVTNVAQGKYIYKVCAYVETSGYTAWGEQSAGLSVSTK